MLNALLLALMLTAQPANADTVHAPVRGSIIKTSSGYTTSRDATTGSSAASVLYVGQKLDSYAVYRSFAGFPVPDRTTADACSLCVFIGTNLSVTDFEIYIVGANAARPTITTADFSNFDGRELSGTYTGTILNTAFSTTGIGDSVWVSIPFNAAGLDSFNVSAGDTLWLAIVSKEDYNNSEPTDYEHVVFSIGPSGEYTPYLSYTPGVLYSRQTPYSLSPTPVYDKSPVPFYRGY